MPLVNIRAALETALATISPTVSTAYENAAFVPVIGVPYMAAFLMPANPQNPTLGDGFYREVGTFQVNLLYPMQLGSLAAVTQAQKIQTLFKRGAAFVNGGVTVRIMTTPTIGAGASDTERFMVPVKVSYAADIFG